MIKDILTSSPWCHCIEDAFFATSSLSSPYDKRLLVGHHGFFGYLIDFEFYK
jgi:hypothetical protein